MRLKANTTWTAICFVGFTSLAASAAQAAIVDGQIASVNEYEWNTTTPPNSKWNTRGGNEEVDDGSGGNAWDINYLGTTIANGEFQVGVTGGSILSGSNEYNGVELTLSDIAINIVEPNETVTDPATDPAGWDYALRLDSTDLVTGVASFSLYSLVDPDNVNPDGTWKESGKDNGDPYSYGSTKTFRMEGGTLLADDITGIYDPKTDDDGVLETSFDLGLLGLFDEQTGGSVITYITMSCVNDEAIVAAQVSPVPVPAAFWLFGSGLIGLIGFGKRRKST